MGSAGYFLAVVAVTQWEPRVRVSTQLFFLLLFFLLSAIWIISNNLHEGWMS